MIGSVRIVTEKERLQREQIRVIELRNSPAVGLRMRDELRFERRVVVLDVVRQVRLPKPMPIRQQVQPADHRVVGCENVTYERGCRSQQGTVPQVLDQLTSANGRLGLDGGPQRRPIWAALLKLCEVTDEGDSCIAHHQRLEHLPTDVPGRSQTRSQTRTTDQ
ncbi:hypothetical protein ABZ943_00545 [Streptomyces rubiginosohelvolus]|uniref:hypothetical protein n=1 Tax=Streptomyces rubiginosohelvolus TaxID=67362 RepID=UPI0033E82AD9